MRNNAAIALLAICHLLSAAAAPTQPPASPTSQPRAVLKTSLGIIEINLLQKHAPQAVANFVSLARQGFYNGKTFFKVVPEFLLQSGDPENTGAGGPGYDIDRDKNKDNSHDRSGIVSMLPGEGGRIHGSQFAIILRPTPHLDKRNQIFGEVVAGLDIAKKIAAVPTRAAQPINAVTIESIDILPAEFKIGPYTTHRRLKAADYQKMTEAQAKNLASKLSEAQDLGEVQKITLTSAVPLLGKVQVTYDVDFAKRKASKLIVFGWVARQKFHLSEMQFILQP